MEFRWDCHLFPLRNYLTFIVNVLRGFLDCHSVRIGWSRGFLLNEEYDTFVKFDGTQKIRDCITEELPKDSLL